jgi:hypothetical protein
MTRDQRRLVYEWIAAFVLVVVVVVAGHYLTPRQLGWARWLIFPFVLMARMAMPYGEAERRGRANINEIADEHHWVKWWAFVWAVFFFGGAIFLSRSSYRVADQDTLSVLFLSFAVVLSPLVVLIEREKFRDLGE